MEQFSHIDEAGDARMVDVGQKEITAREAVAVGRIYMSDTCFSMVQAGTMKKGDVLTVAQIAGIMGAKKTSDLIPLCHILALTKCDVTFSPVPEDRAIEARCLVRCQGRTGVEMEALTGVSIALLTVYDMCKAVDKNMHIEQVHLVEKKGGKSGHFIYGKGDDLHA